jgi:hypothetical protein
VSGAVNPSSIDLPVVSESSFPSRTIAAASQVLPEPGDQALERALWYAQRALDVLALRHGECDPDAVCLSRVVARLSGRVIKARDIEAET